VTTRLSFKKIVNDNEQAIARALADGRNIEAYLLYHALFESLLRLFLKAEDDKIRFTDLILRYKDTLKLRGQAKPVFVDELTKFNQRRNRIIHKLWQQGYTATNENTKDAVAGAGLIYGLFIEWIETFDSGIAEAGFENN